MPGSATRCAGVVGQEVVGNAARPGPGEVPLGDGGEDEAAAVGRREPLGMLEEGAHDGAADGAGAEHRDAEGVLAGHRGDRSATRGPSGPPGVTRRRGPPATLRGDDHLASCEGPLLQRDPAVRRRRTSATTSARSATTSPSRTATSRSTASSTSTPSRAVHDPDRAPRPDARDGRRAAGPRPGPRERCTLFVQSHRPEVTELMWLFSTVTPVELAAADADVQGEAGQPARRRQPRAPHLPGPPGGRHRPLQGVGRAGRQGPGGAPGALARDRAGVQRPLRRDLPRAAGRLHRGAGRPRHRRREEDVEVGRETRSRSSPPTTRSGAR